MIDLNTFAEAVVNMRIAQKHYFKHRSTKLLNQAKAAEAVVDQMLKELAPTNIAVAAQVAEQMRLF